MQGISIRKTKRILGRIAVLTVAALPVAIALTYPGLDWFEQLRSWSERAPRAAREHPRPGSPRAVITVTPERPLGTDSSTSPVPLPLILVRTQPGRNSSEGLAQIGVNARTPQTYRAGAILANGARLSEIHPSYVILQRDGRLARLDLQGSVSTQHTSVLLTVGGGDGPALVHAVNTDPFTDYLRPSPIFHGQQLYGYTLYAGRHQDPFFQMGLRPGDVVTQINGEPVRDPEATLASLHSLLDGAALTVEIQRDGAPVHLSLDGAILAQALTAPPPAVRAWPSKPGTHDFDATAPMGAMAH